jgi:hypothetical protein
MYPTAKITLVILIALVAPAAPDQAAAIEAVAQRGQLF